MRSFILALILILGGLSGCMHFNDVTTTGLSKIKQKHVLGINFNDSEIFTYETCMKNRLEQADRMAKRSQYFYFMDDQSVCHNQALMDQAIALNPNRRAGGYGYGGYGSLMPSGFTGMSGMSGMVPGMVPYEMSRGLVGMPMGTHGVQRQANAGSTASATSPDVSRLSGRVGNLENGQRQLTKQTVVNGIILGKIADKVGVTH